MTVIFLMLLFGSALAATGGGGSPGADDVEALGVVSLRLPVGAASPGALAEGRWLAARGCEVALLARDERDAIHVATARLRSMLDDPELALLVLTKRDWTVPGRDGNWRDDASAGARAWRALRLSSSASSTELELLSYGPAAGASCVSLAGDATNAYALPDRGLLGIRRGYLEQFVAGGRGDVSQLAGTLVHEILHGLGFVHPGADDVSAIAAYRRTVPVWFACAARYWPQVSDVRDRCDPAPGAVARAD